jgi:uncharacterized glyoxalase superfamily protein PhnB
VPCTISSVSVETDDVPAAEKLYAALGVADRVAVRPAQAPASGFHGYTLSIVTSQPGNVDAYLDAAVQHGASLVKPGRKSLWGYGGSFRAPDGSTWTVASSSKKDTAPPALEHDDLVLLLGVGDVKAAKGLHVERGFEVGRGFGSKYVEFASAEGITLALQSRQAVAKNAGVDPDGSGSHRLEIHSDAGECTDPDGYVWIARVAS